MAEQGVSQWEKMYKYMCNIFSHWLGAGPGLFSVWLKKAPTNERRCSICSIISHWWTPCLYQCLLWAQSFFIIQWAPFQRLHGSHGSAKLRQNYFFCKLRQNSGNFINPLAIWNLKKKAKHHVWGSFSLNGLINQQMWRIDRLQGDCGGSYIVILLCSHHGNSIVSYSGNFE